MAWLERPGQFQNLWHQNLVNKQLQYTYLPISDPAMKFGQLIEYNWEKIFLKNHTQNVIEKLFPGPFLKNKSWTYLWINILKFYIFCFSCLPSFFKKQRCLELMSLPHFLHDFWRKIFLLLYYSTWPNLNVWLPLLCEILGNMCFVIAC